MPLRSYKDLTVWKKSVDLVAEVYKVTSRLPRSERFGLASQMQRAAVSIPANIAEGYHRTHRAEYRQFLSISYGSGAELETHLEVCRRIPDYAAIDLRPAGAALDEVMRMLNTMRAHLG